jgi:2'-5' RNA ligase
MNPELENSLIDSITEFSLTHKKFLIRLNDFGAFPPKVIFIEVEKNKMLEELQASFADLILLQHKFSVKKDDRPLHPHVTLATKDLHKKAFKEAWEILAPKKYEAGWEATGISLLRHNKKNWDVIFTSQFTD